MVPVEWLHSAVMTPEQHPATPATTPSLGAQSLIGKKVSHYRVIDIIGGGGMGMVYRAQDLKLSRMVALKFLPEELANHAGALQRFERQARTASLLNHHKIHTVHAIAKQRGKPFSRREMCTEG